MSKRISLDVFGEFFSGYGSKRESNDRETRGPHITNSVDLGDEFFVVYPHRCVIRCSDLRAPILVIRIIEWILE